MMVTTQIRFNLLNGFIDTFDHMFDSILFLMPVKVDKIDDRFKFKNIFWENLVSLNKKLFSVHDCDQLEKVVTRYFMEQFKHYFKLEIFKNGNMEARPAFNEGPM